MNSTMRRLRLVLPIFAVAYALLACLRTVGDFDTGWHLATGRYLLQHHAIPATDVLSYTSPGAPWLIRPLLERCSMPSSRPLATPDSPGSASLPPPLLAGYLLVARSAAGECRLRRIAGACRAFAGLPHHAARRPVHYVILRSLSCRALAIPSRRARAPLAAASRHGSLGESSSRIHRRPWTGCGLCSLPRFCAPVSRICAPMRDATPCAILAVAGRDRGGGADQSLGSGRAGAGAAIGRAGRQLRRQFPALLESFRDSRSLGTSIRQAFQPARSRQLVLVAASGCRRCSFAAGAPAGAKLARP